MDEALVALGLVETSLEEMYSAGEVLFKTIDKHRVHSLDVHHFKRELMKLNNRVPQKAWSAFFAFLGTGIDNRVQLNHLHKAIRKHLRAMGHSQIGRRSPASSQKPHCRQKYGEECFWVRGDATLNRLSGTKMFDTSVVRASDLRWIHGAFGEIDRDNSGCISLREMKSYMSRCAPHLLPSTTSLFNRADVTKQGRVTFEQLMRVLFPSVFTKELKHMIRVAHPIRQEHKAKMDPDVVRDIEDIFRIYDENGDGTLDVEEFSSGIATLGWSASDAEQIFEDIDGDGSGLVSLQEFIQWFAESGKTGNTNVSREVSDTDTKSIEE